MFGENSEMAQSTQYSVQMVSIDRKDMRSIFLNAIHCACKRIQYPQCSAESYIKLDICTRDSLNPFKLAGSVCH